MLTIYNNLDKEDSNGINKLLKKLSDRADNTPEKILNTVNSVISDVRKNGDSALKKYTEQFDNVQLENFYMSESEKKILIEKVPAALRHTMEKAAENIFAFHEKQKAQSWVDMQNGKVMGQRVIPLRRVGMYVPGGTAAYPSSVLMNAIPAKVAGVRELVMVTPPKLEGINPAVICAAEIAGITDIITVGGAQIIAALAYGTESIERVDKIVGPGNIYVATAKRLVYGAVDIDMIAGPSEVLVIADEKSNAKYIAADLMSQAEHDPMAAAILITTSSELVRAVQNEIDTQIASLSRRNIINTSLSENGAAVIVDTIADAIELSNIIAPEHLELALDNPFEYLGAVTNAGSVFLGENSPEPLGDYFAGPNHVLPTNGTARFASALSVDSFTKKSSYLYYSAEELEKIKADVIRFAETEGLDAHANSIRIRKL